MTAILATLAFSVLGPSVRHVYVDSIVSSCSRSSGFRAAPWEETSSYGFFSFDGTTRWIIANTPPKRELLACTRRWSGFFIEPTSDPLPIRELGNAPYLEEWTSLGAQGFRYHPGAA